MHLIRTIFFAAAVVCAGSIHAQGCSGGADGGMDATGNQCGDASLVGTKAVGDTGATAAIATPGIDHQRAESASSGAGQQEPMAREPRRLIATNLVAPRLAHVTVASATASRTAKSEGTRDATCSGGADGGMDATGNQCSAYIQDSGNVAVADAVIAPRQPSVTAERRSALAAISAVPRR